jgi:hypothetical protein
LEFSAIVLALHYDFLSADTQRKIGLPPCQVCRRLAIPNPTWSTSTIICGHIIVATRGTTIYQSGVDHLSVLENGKAELRKHSLESSENKMDASLQELPNGENMTI